MNETDLRELFCRVGRWMYEREFVTATDGNMSVRLPDGSFLFTPTGACLGDMRPDEIVRADAEGRPALPGQRVTAEWRMHMTAYRLRPDVGAVLHGHPPWTLAATVAGISLAEPVLPEVVFHLGSIPTAPYAMPASEESGVVIRDLVGTYDAIALDRHGAVSVDATLVGAFRKLEYVEQTARLIVRVKMAGMLKVLTAEQVEKLRRARAEHGLNPDAIPRDILP